ncbi:MAG: hypothetical protein ACRENS_07645 [Candidatus Eiseniibacteriota bacterium]
MRSSRLASALALATLASFLLPGCGNHTLTLNVDVYSFLDPTDVETSIEPHVPPTPAPGVWLSEDTFPPLVNDKTIQLASGVDQFASVRSVTFHIAVEATDTTGTGADTLRVYLSGPNQPPRPGTPVVVVPLSFTPPILPALASIDTVEVTLDQSQAEAQLFTGKSIRLSITNAVRGPVGVPGVDPDLSGRVRLIRLDATVIAGHESF